MIRLLTIKEILQYIEDNLDIYNIDIDSLVTRSGYSRRNLQLLFKYTNSNITLEFIYIVYLILAENC